MPPGGDRSRPSPSERRRGGYRIAATLAVVAVFAAHAWFFRLYVTDDAFISFRYLRNLLAGNGLTYNPGERVWGYSNLLWIAVLSVPARIGIDPVAAARWLGVALDLAVVLLVLAPLRRAREGGWNPLGAALLVTNGAFVLQGANGLETSLFTFLIVVATCLHRASRFALLGLALALAGITRPEGVLLAGFVLLHVFLDREGSEAAGPSRVGAFLVGFLPPIVVFEVLAHAYYGVWWPNALDAKVRLSGEQILRGAVYLRSFVVAYPVPAAVLLIATASLRTAGPKRRFVIGAAWFLAALYVTAGGDWMLGYRLFHPVLALCAMLVPFAGTAIADRLPGLVFGRGVVVTAVVLACLANLAPSVWNRHVHDASARNYVHRGIVIGRWMKEHLPSGSLLATNTAGTLGYYSVLPIVDMLGINDRAIAAREDVPAGWNGIEKGDGAYVLARRPDFIQLGSANGSREPLFLSDCEIFLHPSFWRDYTLLELEVEGAGRLVLYGRRPAPAETGPSDEEWRRIREIANARIEESAFRY